MVAEFKKGAGAHVAKKKVCLRLVGKLLLEVAGFTIVVVAYSLHGRC